MGPALPVMPQWVLDHRPPITVLLTLLEVQVKEVLPLWRDERPGQWKAGAPSPRGADQHGFHTVLLLCSPLGPHREKKGSFRGGEDLSQRKGLAECPQKNKPKGWEHTEQKAHRRSILVFTAFLQGLKQLPVLYGS